MYLGNLPFMVLNKFFIKGIYKKGCIFILTLAVLFFISSCSGSAPKMQADDASQLDRAEEIEITVQQNDRAFIQEDKNAGLALASDMKKIIDRGKLIVGIYSKDMPPFFMTNENGELYGNDINIANDIAEHLNVGIEFDRSASTYRELFEKAAQGEVDIVISKFSVTYERAKFIRFTEPYLEMRRALLVNRKHAMANDAEDYPIDFLESNSVKIGVKANTSYVAFAKELFPNASLVELPEWHDVVELLVKGEITAAMYDELEVIKLVRLNPDISLYASVYILKDQKDLISMAVPYGSTQLLSWIDWFMKYKDIKTNVDMLIKNYPEVFAEN